MELVKFELSLAFKKAYKEVYQHLAWTLCFDNSIAYSVGLDNLHEKAEELTIEFLSVNRNYDLEQFLANKEVDHNKRLFISIA